MLRASLMTAVALSAATAAHAQLASPTAYIEVGIGGIFPDSMEGDTTIEHPVLAYRTAGDGDVNDTRVEEGVVVSPTASDTAAPMTQVIEFVNAFGGYGELGVTTEINGQLKGVGLIGASYSTPKFAYENEWAVSSTRTVTSSSDSEINAGLFSYYVGAGLEYAVAPQFNIGANLKLGGSTLSYENYDYTVTDSEPSSTVTSQMTDPAYTGGSISGAGASNSGDVSGFMVAPEAKFSFEVAPTVDLVATGGAGFHFLDGEEFLAGTLVTYQGSAGIRFNLK